MEYGTRAESTGPLKCSKCGNDGVLGKSFCPGCGALLAIPISGPAIDSYIQERIRDQIEGSFKDKHLVEFETTEAIVNRLANWAKVSALSVGVPVAICALVLGLLGYNNIQDAKRLTSEASERIRPVV